MRRLTRTALTLVCLGLIVGAIATLFVPTLVGYRRYVITGGSMTGSIPKGSVIYSRLVPVDGLSPGDVITFVPPDFDKPVTHRIVSIERDKYGKLAFSTKGDANPAEDPWTLRLIDPVQARYAFHIPYLGYALAYLAVRQIRMLLIGLPAVLIALSMLVSLWREAGRELERVETSATEPPGGDGDGLRVDAAPDPSATDARASARSTARQGRADPFGGLSDAELATLRGWW